ncbi:Malonyl-[acyl-carrier protein] O-methyltransferase [Gimesia panareensis]|uniref:Malonyl-[acyl-carrier protein] O-methyltransferase n=1 Tax=Gimesia panareensis TaxID=2527978 RepID=A0A518FW33_9PLAN|nr:class I SAM-dependent methyltransferase [Gimesia panareensis]QDV20558.1 Malonyl-[acyl-carrier protein] O-methyltransferase [Gimesia panareensis]
MKLGKIANPFDNPALIDHYEQWYVDQGHRADRLEKRLLNNMLKDISGIETMLEIGCGTGHFTRWMSSLGYQAMGLDLSEGMLAEAHKWDGIPYILGDAEMLPFKGQTFDISALITTLEFVADPECALTEAIRVAKRGVLLGVLNQQSLLAARRRKSGKTPWDTAHFFSPDELVRLVRTSAGKRLCSVRWKTTLWPFPIWGSLPLPWGGFIGLLAVLR